MGGWINRSLGWLQSDAKPAPRTHGNPDLNTIDTRCLAKEMDLEQEAERLGKRELPASADTTLLGSKYRVIEVIERVRHGYVGWGSQRERLLKKTNSSTDLTQHAQQVLQLDMEFELRAGVHPFEWSKTLHQLNAAVGERDADSNAFQKASAFERPVQTPSNLVRWIRALGLVALVLIEYRAPNRFPLVTH